jgi:hypothetical protein
VLHDAGGLADVRQLTQVVSLAHAVSWLQQEAVRQSSQATTPVVSPQVIPPLDVLVDEVEEEEDVELLELPAQPLSQAAASVTHCASHLLLQQ